jgi:outer membrane lipoprotein SlyB
MLAGETAPSPILAGKVGCGRCREQEAVTMRSLAGLLVAAMLLASCSHPSSKTYQPADVGRTIETTPGSVISSRMVQVAGEADAIGPAAGGAVGAATGGIVFKSGWPALLGGVIGAGIGYLSQVQLNDREGIEYILQMDDGRTVTLVQNREEGEEPIAAGTPVLVQVSGSYTRIIPDPRPDRAGTVWVDPDSLPPADPAEGGGVDAEAHASSAPPIEIIPDDPSTERVQ